MGTSSRAALFAQLELVTPRFVTLTLQVRGRKLIQFGRHRGQARSSF